MPGTSNAGNKHLQNLEEIPEAWSFNGTSHLTQTWNENRLPGYQARPGLLKTQFSERERRLVAFT